MLLGYPDFRFLYLFPISIHIAIMLSYAVQCSAINKQTVVAMTMTRVNSAVRIASTTTILESGSESESEKFLFQNRVKTNLSLLFLPVPHRIFFSEQWVIFSIDIRDDNKSGNEVI